MSMQVSAVSGKGLDSGWSKVRDGLEDLGFRVTDEQETENPPDGDSIYVHVPDANRGALIQALATMPDEAFDWIVLALQRSAMTQGAGTQIWPDGIGGFTDESRKSVDTARKAAIVYIEDKKN